MLGKNFPVSDFVKEHILDAVTISRGGGWWTAILLIEDPDTKEPFLNLYRWRLRREVWKLDKSFPIKRKHLGAMIEAINELSKAII